MPLRVRLSDGLGMRQEVLERMASMGDDGTLQRLMGPRHPLCRLDGAYSVCAVERQRQER